jgi:hypothetical protein
MTSLFLKSSLYNVKATEHAKEKEEEWLGFEQLVLFP